MTSSHMTSRCFVSFYRRPPRRDSRPPPLCSALLCTQLSLIPRRPPAATVVRCSDSTGKMNLCHQDRAGPPSPRGIPAHSPLTSLMNLPLPPQRTRCRIQRFEAGAPPLAFRDTGQPQRNVPLMTDVTRLGLTDRPQMQFVLRPCRFKVIQIHCVLEMSASRRTTGFSVMLMSSL